MNYKLLVAVYRYGYPKEIKMDPKDIEIDLMNLKEEGLIKYDTIDNIVVTEEGRRIAEDYIEGIIPHKEEIQ